MKGIKTTFFFVFFTLYSIQCPAEIYKWVDEKGRTHFTDQKHPQKTVENIELKERKSAWQPYDINIADISNTLTPRETSRIQQDVNRIYWFYDRVLFFDMYKTVPVHITVLPDREGYNQYIRGKGYSGEGSLGMYFRKDNEIVVFIQKNRARTFQTIKHETSHAIVDTVTPYLPSWLNEGLAEVMETLIDSGSTKIIKRQTKNARHVVYQLNNHKLLDIQTFLSKTSQSWRKTNNHKSYLQTQTGEFCYFLLSTVHGKNFIVRLIHNYERGNRTLSAYLVNKMYTGGIRSLEDSWLRWLKESELDGYIQL